MGRCACNESICWSVWLLCEYLCVGLFGLSGIHLHFVVTIPYILDVIMSCTMHILFKGNKVKLIELKLIRYE